MLKNGSAACGISATACVCLEFTSKSNSLDEAIIWRCSARRSPLVKEKLQGAGDLQRGQNFSVGANLGTALFAANIAAWGEIEKAIAGGQQAYKALKYAPFPVVAAPAGMALGGGCEILLHSDAVQAHAESYIGLVECGVGLLPGWGGCKEMLARWTDAGKLPGGPMPAPAKVFEMVEHGHHVQIRGAGQGVSVPAPDRRHHDEPRPAAGGRQGEGALAGGGLQAARAAGDAACRARPARWR